jgi:hypothetical protein
VFVAKASLQNQRIKKIALVAQGNCLGNISAKIQMDCFEEIQGNYSHLLGASRYL